MKIAICGSMAFANEMHTTKKLLEELGHTVQTPGDLERFILSIVTVEDKWKKIDRDALKEYYGVISCHDAVLVLNYDKNNVPNYVGGSTLIEIGFAYVLDKKIFLLNPIPHLSYTDEIAATKPHILYGDLKQIA